MEAILLELKRSVETLREYDIDTGEPTYELKEVDDEDWANAWKQYFKPLRITDRLTIKPTWEEYTPGPDELILELDPGMAFGTGTHATTALCLKTLERVIQGGEDVIDVGTAPAFWRLPRRSWEQAACLRSIWIPSPCPAQRRTPS